MNARITTNGIGMTLIKTCAACGANNATHGHGVNLTAAMRAHRRGDRVAYEKYLGIWYCGPCNPKEEK